MFPCSPTPLPPLLPPFPLPPVPDMMRKMQVDRGAIKFVMSGANIMCSVLTSSPLHCFLPFSLSPSPITPHPPLPHPDPGMMCKMQVDRGAIKFVMPGANIMCPGLTSPGGKKGDGIPVNSPVAIFAEGKENALAIGYTKMSSDNIRKINKAIGVNLMHYLNDGLWK
ncbi:unnamed protein product, partial [Closterium sp. NIES-53]